MSDKEPTVINIATPLQIGKLEKLSFTTLINLLMSNEGFFISKAIRAKLRLFWGSVISFLSPVRYVTRLFAGVKGLEPKVPWLTKNLPGLFSSKQISGS